MAKIHNITGNHLSSDGGGSGGSDWDMDVSKYATITYSDSEDNKIKKYVDDLGVTGKKYVDEQIAAIEIPDTEVNLEGYATTEQLESVDEASIFRDDAIKNEINSNDNLNTAAHLKLEDDIQKVENDILNVHEQSKTRDSELQEQIDSIDELVSGSNAEFKGSLKWVEGNWNTNNLVDAAYAQIKIHIARTHMVLNHDTEDSGRVNWATQLEPYPATIGLLVEDAWYWAVVEYLGDGGQSNRGKNFKITDHNLPATGVISDQTPVAIYSNYTPGINLDGYATVEYSDSEDEKLQGQVNEITEDLDDIKTQLGVILEPETDSASYMFIGDNQWVGSSGQFSANLEKNRIATFLFSESDFGSNPVDFDSLNPGDILYFQNPQVKQQQEERSVEVYESVVHTWVVERVAKEGDLFRIWVANEAKSPFLPDNLYDMQIHHKGRLADPDEKAEVDIAADYDWTGHHKYKGTNVEINNVEGGVTYKGYKSDYSGTNGRSFMRFQLNANGEYYMHFGPTSAYWETRWTLNTGKMTWAQTHTGDTSVEIDKYGLKVQGSSVTRNATMLQALKSSTDFESLKAKLVELLEAEVASYEVDKEEGC